MGLPNLESIRHKEEFIVNTGEDPGPFVDFSAPEVATVNRAYDFAECAVLIGKDPGTLLEDYFSQTGRMQA